MASRKFKPLDNPNAASRLGQLITNEPVAVYYRQSTNAQVGNISTSMQTLDMVEELKQRGWEQENIILIDDDEGVSGTKRIDEREGMSKLFELIAERKIGAVACQDEDRLFRDMTQIQVNIFIDVCRKSDVKVITPFFTYDFAHPLHGEFHARQFRFKCDMAAEYLKSYVLGRLAPARLRLIKEGKWAGSGIPIGYMADNRKLLITGQDNPNWRKYVPFEPYAELVREYFRIFIECGGAVRKTIYTIRDRGLGIPQVKPPDGFKVNYHFKKRDGGFFLNRGNLVRLLTNPVYIGHWCYQGALIRWNNHEPLVDVETFMQVFNALSRYTLEGEDNKDYRPTYPHIRPERDRERPTERPLLSGLLFTTIDGKRYKTGSIFPKKQGCYLYAQNRVELGGVATLWVRQSSWIDEAVILRFKERLQATFDSGTWMEVIKDTEQLSERDRKIRRIQLQSLDDERENLILSLRTLTLPDLIHEVENRFKHVEQERQRLQKELADLDVYTRRQFDVEQASEIFQRALSDWDNMTNDEQRNLLALFIDSIEATNFNRAGDMTLIVSWRDGSQDRIELWHKSHGNRWTIENVQKLLSHLDNGATQLEIASLFPDFKWYQIYNEIKKHRGLVRFTPSWLGKDETYRMYEASGGRKGRASGSYWQPAEIETLKELVARQATQREFMEAFPFRRWVFIKERINKVFGKGIQVELSGIGQRKTYTEYVQEQKTLIGEFCSERSNWNFLSLPLRARGFRAPRYLASRR